MRCEAARRETRPFPSSKGAISTRRARATAAACSGLQVAGARRLEPLLEGGEPARDERRRAPAAPRLSRARRGGSRPARAGPRATRGSPATVNGGLAEPRPRAPAARPGPRPAPRPTPRGPHLVPGDLKPGELEAAEELRVLHDRGEPGVVRPEPALLEQRARDAAPSRPRSAAGAGAQRSRVGLYEGSDLESCIGTGPIQDSRSDPLSASRSGLEWVRGLPHRGACPCSREPPSPSPPCPFSRPRWPRRPRTRSRRRARSPASSCGPRPASRSRRPRSSSPPSSRAGTTSRRSTAPRSSGSGATAARASHEADCDPWEPGHQDRAALHRPPRLPVRGALPDAGARCARRARTSCPRPSR